MTDKVEVSQRARELLKAAIREFGPGKLAIMVQQPAALMAISAALAERQTSAGKCDHEWVNEACDGNTYLCQRCPAVFIYDRDADCEPTPPVEESSQGAGEDVAERVARAMAEAEGWRWGNSEGPTNMVNRCASGQESSRARDTWRKRARAALKAS